MKNCTIIWYLKILMMKIRLKHMPSANYGSCHVSFMVKIADQSFLDVTSVCLIEGFQNQNFMMMADRILKEVGKDLAAERIKVFLFPLLVYLRS